MKSARLCAFETLYKIFYDKAYSNLALDAALAAADAKDKAFTASLVYGVTERKLTLDYLLTPYLKGKTKPKVKIILYLGVYQLCFLDKVPASAAINESVKLADAVGCSFYKGLINAVLHRVNQQRIALSEIDDLSVRYSCPQALINLWKKQYGEAAMLQILEASLGKPPVYAVPNSLFADAEELQYELLDEGVECEVDGALVKIVSGVNPAATKAFGRGLFHIEDKSAYECACALAPERTDIVFDVCSAPGGKAFTLAERMHGEGKIFAFDLYEHRVDLIQKGAERLCLTNIEAGRSDATVFREDLPQADKILCDVPCSGFGIIRRKPEIKYKALDSVTELPVLQLQILSVSARYLKTGGKLMYATCTLNRKENNKVVAAFLEKYRNYRLLSEQTIFPSADGGDGFYYALLEKMYD